MYTRQALFIIVFCGLLAAMPSRLLAVDGTPSWIFSTVAAPPVGSYISSPSLAFDNYGTPAVSWSRATHPSGTHSVHLSQLLGLGLWHTQNLGTAGNNSGLLTSLAFDRAERPVVAWVNFNGTVEASFNGGTAQSFGSSAATNFPIIDISYDLTGNLRGMFSRTTLGSFFDISHTSSTFSATDMNTVPGFTQLHDAAMITDGRGLRQMALRGSLSSGGQGVVIASEPPFTSTSWPSAVLASATNVFGVDIARDPTDGHAALAYTTFDSGSGESKLFYSKFTGTFMQTTEIFSSTIHRFEDVSLDFDSSDGRPAIAYERRAFSPSAEELHFAYLDASQTWQTVLVDPTVSMTALGARPRRPSLAFDRFGTTWPAIAYIDADGSLAVAFDPPAPEPATLALLGMFSLLIRRGSKQKMRRNTVR